MAEGARILVVEDNDKNMKLFRDVLLAKGFRIVEIPIVFTDRVEGQSKMSKRIVREAVWMVWSLRFRALIGKL